MVVHRPTNFLDLRAARNWALDIENDTNQTLTAQLIGGHVPNPPSMGNVGGSFTVTAGETEPVLTNLWVSFLSIEISFATGPTDGTDKVTVTASKQFFI